MSVQARVVALAILWHRNDKTGLCFPSRKRLAEMLGVSVPTVQRAITELRESGLLVVTRTRSSSRYAFNVKVFDVGMFDERTGVAFPVVGSH